MSNIVKYYYYYPKLFKMVGYRKSSMSNKYYLQMHSSKNISQTISVELQVIGRLKVNINDRKFR